MIDRNKRNLLFGRLHSSDTDRDRQTPFYPPWAQPEKRFLESCTRCNKCINICPENIIGSGDGGFPEINFENGECTFCEKCINECETGALHKNTPDQPPWLLTAHIQDNCLSLQNITCSRCADECESRSINLNYSAHGISTPTVNSDSCTGCGACVSNCPVKAITIRNEAKKNRMA